jgi:hypothetical protein
MNDVATIGLFSLISTIATFFAAKSSGEKEKYESAQNNINIALTHATRLKNDLTIDYLNNFSASLTKETYTSKLYFIPFGIILYFLYNFDLNAAILLGLLTFYTAAVGLATGGKNWINLNRISTAHIKFKPNETEKLKYSPDELALRQIAIQAIIFGTESEIPFNIPKDGFGSSDIKHWFY